MGAGKRSDSAPRAPANRRSGSPTHVSDSQTDSHVPLLFAAAPVRRDPPAAPEIPRACRLTKRQWIGLPILFAIPVLALLGVFGEHTAVQDARSAALVVRVEYPDRVHYGEQTTARVTVRNATARRMDTITVAFDTAYMHAFSAVRTIPAETRAHMVPLVGVAPDETRLVVAGVEGQDAGWHRGVLTVTAGGDTLRIPLATLVFP